MMKPVKVKEILLLGDGELVKSSLPSLQRVLRRMIKQSAQKNVLKKKRARL